jgi:hypothetical protein
MAVWWNQQKFDFLVSLKDLEMSKQVRPLATGFMQPTTETNFVYFKF